jgi:hypothetical protein
MWRNLTIKCPGTTMVGALMVKRGRAAMRRGDAWATQPYCLPRQPDSAYCPLRAAAALSGADKGIPSMSYPGGLAPHSFHSGAPLGTFSKGMIDQTIARAPVQGPVPTPMCAATTAARVKRVMGLCWSVGRSLLPMLCTKHIFVLGRSRKGGACALYASRLPSP